MTTRTHPPFRADHVGSFLRPRRLLEARERKARGEITAEALREVEDEAIAAIVRFQEDVGLRSVTDGEFRRTYFHIDFLEQLGGVKTDIPVTIRKPDGSEELAPPVMRVIDKVRHVKDIQRADFEYLKSRVSAGHTPEGDDPVADDAALRGGRAGISREHYPDLEPFYQDVADAYGDELRSLAAAGCTLRADGRHQPRLPVRRQDARGGALARRRPDELPHRYASFINRVVAQKPAG
jgi:5-methyltetrahydropteroyltriglutamate--homocysteine methyltransferase